MLVYYFVPYTKPIEQSKKQPVTLSSHFQIMIVFYVSLGKLKAYTDIYVNTQQILFNTILFYFARGDMFRPLIQPSSGQLTIEQYLLCAHNMGSLK